MEPDLSFIRPDIRYENARPLDPKAVIPLLNEYLLRVSDIQNACTAKLERAMAELECRLDRTETLLCLLEKRLERVELVTVESVAPPPSIQQPAAVESDELPAEIPVVQQPAAEEERREEEAGDKMKISEHPSYSKFFKMLRLGIPEAAVRQKMGGEGVDPSVLSDPNRLVDAVRIPDSDSSGDELSDSS